MTAAAVADAIRAYAARGWRPIALHNVPAAHGPGDDPDTACTCVNDRNPKCRSQGKHPVHSNWQKIILSPEHLIEVMLPVRPRMNVGIATGEHSKMWVLDVDDLDALAALVAEHGPLPPTWTQRTGGGGLQFAFAIPSDFTPTNSAGRLPDGIDVRGDGGQIVAAPSVSVKGAYVVTDDRDPAPAPDWLLDLVRPIARITRGLSTTSLGNPRDLDRLAKYAATAVAGKLRDIREATSGRNTLSWGKACDLIRLVNAEWSGLDLDEVYQQWVEAVADHPSGVHVPDSEITSLWRNALKTAGTQEADPPPDTMPQPEVIELAAPLPFGSTSPPEGGTPDTAPSRLPTAAEVEQLLLAIPDDLDRRDLALKIAPMLFTLDDAELIPYREVLKQTGRLKYGEFDKIVKVERGKAAAAEVERRRAEQARQAAEPSRKDTELPHRAAPTDVARELAKRFAARGLHLRNWRGDWYDHQGTHYEVFGAADVRHAIQTATEPCWYNDPQDGPQPWNPDTASLNKVIDAYAHGPGFIPTRTDPEPCIALTNVALDPVTFQPMPHSPERFNTWSLPYAYDPRATCPQWLAFLEQVIPDPESRLLLQQWFGYMISGRTDLQKILSLFGAPRSGKGTILRVLNAFIGRRNVATETLDTLAQQFGRESLIGKTLLQITDADWKSKDLAAACGALKAISGEDDAGVPRKNRTNWQGTLSTKIVLLANEEPRFNDPSGALLGRMIHIEFTRSWIGREDPTLTARLLTELPGIFTWALAGLASLNAGGRLIVPTASRLAAEEIAMTTSPVAGFLRDRCVFVDPEACVATYLDDLYSAYAKWSLRVGRRRTSERDVFARDLYSAARGRVVKRRAWVGEGAERHQTQAVFGVELLPIEVPAAAPKVDAFD